MIVIRHKIKENKTDFFKHVIIGYFYNFYIKYTFLYIYNSQAKSQNKSRLKSFTKLKFLNRNLQNNIWKISENKDKETKILK